MTYHNARNIHIIILWYIEHGKKRMIITQNFSENLTKEIKINITVWTCIRRR